MLWEVEFLLLLLVLLSSCLSLILESWSSFVRLFLLPWWCRESLLVVSVERRAYSDVLELLCLARFFLH